MPLVGQAKDADAHNQQVLIPAAGMFPPITRHAECPRLGLNGPHREPSRGIRPQPPRSPGSR